ncbi:amino acid ABC transporter permease [Rhodoligotrophos defluvii]|uniref:amino acid ABC transporter permease n=1 Tax=Rhodoligotrophos defluvii TaxID=2561934 RepID=UPI001485297B|nr:amino acid ABC transporter permease [Rhodoligotrophos defluvii]
MIWDWSYAAEIMPELLWGVWITLLVTAASAAISLFGGLLLAVFASVSGRAGQFAVRFLIEALRGVPILVLLFFGFYALPQIGLTLSSYTVGILVLGIVYAAYCSEVYRGALLTIPSGLRDACSALGLPKLVTWRDVLIPLAVSKSIPSLVNYVLLLYRQSALLFAIGIPVLMGQAQTVGYERFRYLEPYTLAGVLYLALNLPFVYVLYRYKAKHDEKHI